MADQNEIFNKIKDLIAKQTDVPATDIKMDTNLKEDVDIDSLDFFEVVDGLENEYDIEIESDEDISTVAQLVDYIQKKIAEKDK
ncbi:acyl carrier protein [Fructilactobacillus fructivorans]|uniref:Acyl carrier protein n=1 Tax=Fructilactobacillus fructivorans TaxID=1614 RepID=A0A0C1Q1Q6_9LACO|nr:acyl carrier protein [Fructilactobacillus fructivorans]KID41753.1 Acyl carrier protein [Fructilactobacillus fructivorans]KRK56774.1 acyl carrier protein [Fructilactobacillus fructivorans]KRN11980.1 acyl carrier protein [Fructilactobacillus fructivorans]KRN40485.1 acyl carrier protein [Fructilactobacillus fructivorans]KRN42281.1 acyl carrier protein [Fructilactobacillus fructivorans]